MKSKALIAVLVLLALVAVATLSAAPLTREEAIRRTRELADSNGFHTVSLRELVGILETAKGNIQAVMKCALAVATHGSNTPIIVALASTVAQQETDVAHFDELLVIAMLHQTESLRIQRDLQDYVGGRITIEQLRRRVEPSLYPVLVSGSLR
ncbi:MAG: hypothetical protein AB1649_31330 [Chloroflexota bacterium]